MLQILQLEAFSILILKSKFLLFSTRRPDFYINLSRHDDLKEMLDSNKDSLKLEAMKRIIGVCLLTLVSSPILENTLLHMFCR